MKKVFGFVGTSSFYYMFAVICLVECAVNMFSVSARQYALQYLILSVISQKWAYELRKEEKARKDSKREATK